MAKKAQNFTLTISIDPSRDLPLHLQLYEELRTAMLSKRLRAKTRLPSTRDLAKDLGVSRNTVISAYEQLVAEGYLECEVGAGTFVSDALPDSMLWVGSKVSEPVRLSNGPHSISSRGRRLSGFAPFFPPVTPIPFRHGLPALNEFPKQHWLRMLNKKLQSLPSELLGYGDPAGYRPLREAIATYLNLSRAVKCEPEQILIVAGSQQAIYLVAQVLLDDGDAVWIEDPGYLGARGALIAAGAQLVPVPVDEQGLIVSAGMNLNPNGKLIYVTPSNQYPLTITMSLSRRLELLEWASRSGAWILEDDYDSEFRFKGRPTSSLQGLDEYGRVIYIGTFSKVLAPTLRLGYIVLPPGLIDAFVTTSSLITRHPPSLEQVVLAEFIQEGHFANHIRRMRALYMDKQDEFIELAKKWLEGIVEITRPEMGTHAIAWLGEGADDVAVSKLGYEKRVESNPLSLYCIERRMRPGLVLGYGAFEKDQMEEGMRRLSSAVLMSLKQNA